MNLRTLLNPAVMSIIAYSFCSASMLLVNKLVLSVIPMPSSVTLTQLVAAVALIYLLKFFKVCEVDAFEKDKVKLYSIYVVVFVLSIYANMKTLQASNIETVIIFRAMTPIVVAFMEAFFLGREFPSRRSLFALSLIVLGALGYVNTDPEFKAAGMSAYFWPVCYLLFICLLMTYGKKLVSDVELTLAGSVLYTNALSVVPMGMLFVITSEASTTNEEGANMSMLDYIDPYSFMLLLLSCAVGAGIGFAGWWCRSEVSATSYTLIGVLNKFATITVNLLMWDQHATPLGLACLCLCLLGGVLYQQAPMKHANRPRNGDGSKGKFVPLETIDKPIQDEELELDSAEEEV